jgi:hypothetical protein
MNKQKRCRQVRRTILVYLSITVFCVVFDKVYALFGHGVSSDSMTLMFLYPFLGGVLPFTLLFLFIPQADQVKWYRFLYNAYNSGIATLTIGSLLDGIFEIAGTSSPYLLGFAVCGWSMTAIGLLGYLTSQYCLPHSESRA